MCLPSKGGGKLRSDRFGPRWTRPSNRWIQTRLARGGQRMTLEPGDSLLLGYFNVPGQLFPGSWRLA